MCWLEAAINFLFPEPVEVDMDGEPVDGDTYSKLPEASMGRLAEPPYDWYAPLPEPPEIYLRPELIPVKADGLPAVAEAERVVRSGR